MLIVVKQINRKAKNLEENKVYERFKRGTFHKAILLNMKYKSKRKDKT
jgi:hypothetical protein